MLETNDVVYPNCDDAYNVVVWKFSRRCNADTTKTRRFIATPFLLPNTILNQILFSDLSTRRFLHYPTNRRGGARKNGYSSDISGGIRRSRQGKRGRSRNGTFRSSRRRSPHTQAPRRRSLRSVTSFRFHFPYSRAGSLLVFIK